MMDKELMDDVIRLNDFLDSVFGVMKKVAFFACAFGLGALALVVPLWPLVSQQPALFAIAGLLLLLAGGLAGAAITLVATRGRTKRQIEARDRVIDAMGTEIEELKKRPKQAEVDALISAKDAEIAALRSTKVPTALDMLKASLGDEGIASFRALCAASTYVDGKPARPLVFDLDDEKLSAIGLSEGAVRHMADVGAIRLAASDDRDLVGSNACAEMVDIGEGVAASSGAVRFSLAGGDVVEVTPVHLSHGTDFLVVDSHLAGADLGIVSFTANGSELAAECAALKPPYGMDAYIAGAYSVDMRVSRHGFRCLTKEGELKRP